MSEHALGEVAEAFAHDGLVSDVDDPVEEGVVQHLEERDAREEHGGVHQDGEEAQPAHSSGSKARNQREEERTERPRAKALEKLSSDSV